MIDILLSKSGAIVGGVLAILAILATMFQAAFKAGKNNEQAKIGKANAQTIKDIARANRARVDADRVPDDKYRRD